LKLLLYTHVWMPVIGGVQTVTADLANGLTRWAAVHPDDAIEVTLVTQTPAGDMNDSELAFRVVRKPTLRELCTLMRAADVVHVANPALLPLMLAWLLRKPVVIEHDGYQAACPNGLFLFQPDHSVCPGHFLARRYGKCIECNSREMGRAKSLERLVLTFPRRWLTRNARVNIAPTQHIGLRVALPRTRVIHHGVPNYSQVAISDTSQGNGRPPYFAYVGRLVVEKGLPVLLRACANLAAEGYAFRMRIVGDGTERPGLEKLASELKLDSRVEFLGAFPVRATQRFLGESVAVIMPSIWEDVAPLVAYEQLMHGRLVIAADIGGLGEIVDGVSLKFPVGDADALAACMRRALNEPAMASEVRARAQRRALDAFTQQRMVADHMHVYKELAAEQRQSSRDAEPANQAAR
jgi:glycosyltransferase involved in cell wall biosynthesis